MEGVDQRMTARDVLGYLIAFVAWLLIIALAAVVAWNVFEQVKFVMLLAFVGTDLMERQTTVVAGRINLTSMVTPIILGSMWTIYTIWVEEYFRTAITAARKRRGRMASTSMGKVEDMSTAQQMGLDVLAQRALRVLIFPAALGLIYLLMELYVALKMRGV